MACGQQCTLLDLIASINRVLGTSIEPEFAEPRGSNVRESLADISAAREVLGYSPVIDFDEGLRPSIEYYRSLPQAVLASRESSRWTFRWGVTTAVLSRDILFSLLRVSVRWF